MQSATFLKCVENGVMILKRANRVYCLLLSWSKQYQGLHQIKAQFTFHKKFRNSILKKILFSQNWNKTFPKCALLSKVAVGPECVSSNSIFARCASFLKFAVLRWNARQDITMDWWFLRSTLFKISNQQVDLKKKEILTFYNPWNTSFAPVK